MKPKADARKLVVVGLVLLIWMISIYMGVHSTWTIRKDIAALSAQGNKLVDMAEEFLEERNQCRAKLTGCQDAKMEMFHMYTSCVEEVGELERKKR